MTLRGPAETAVVDPPPSVEVFEILAPPALAHPENLLPSWLTRPRARLGQFIKYVWKVYDIPKQLCTLTDGRKRPSIQTSVVARSLVFTALLRLRSLNALEAELKQPCFQRLLGYPARAGQKVFSADTVGRVLDSLDHAILRRVLRSVIDIAERNKVFREGSYGARRVVALDGWEPFCSYLRHCDHCLVRQVRLHDQMVPQYYHRFVVALLLGPRTEVVLDLEPLRTLDLRRQDGEAADTHDGEQTAALRLLDRLHQTYGRFIDLFVLDALYPNGPMMNRLVEHGYGAVITLKNARQEPLKDALALMQDQPPTAVWSDLEKEEDVKAWDIEGIETLETFKGPSRVLRAEVRPRRRGQKHTWCAAVIGHTTRSLSTRTLHQIHRARWHEENTAFNQWTQLWHLTHVYRHTPGAVVSVMLLWCLAFDLMQLFVFRRLRRPRTPKDPCDTILALVRQMAREVFGLRKPVPWSRLLDFR